MVVERLLTVLITTNLGAAFVLSLVALRGFWSAPFGDPQAFEAHFDGGGWE